MKIIISPAKKMRIDTDTFDTTTPSYLEQTAEILTALRQLDKAQLLTLWKCNDKIVEQNIERLHTMDITRNLTPAILSYEGIQYQYMAPNVFEQSQLAYIQENLRILSGFYGMLRPMDGVTPYRLEMQAKLALGGHKDLYAYWGDKLARQLTAENDVILNLASKEYSRAISAHLPKDYPFITCRFCEEVQGKLVEKGTMCKMARGQMVRYLAEQNAQTVEAVQGFVAMGYQFSTQESTSSTLVFIKKGE